MYGIKNKNQVIIKSDAYSVRYTNTYVVLYNGDEVYINKNDIHNYYSCNMITYEQMNELSNILHNVYIDYCLNGNLSDYI